MKNIFFTLTLLTITSLISSDSEELLPSAEFLQSTDENSSEHTTTSCKTKLIKEFFTIDAQTVDTNQLRVNNTLTVLGSASVAGGLNVQGPLTVGGSPAVGPTGPTGAQGPYGVKTYCYLSSTASPTITSNSLVTFNLPAVKSGMNNTTSSITVLTTGVYAIQCTIAASSLVTTTPIKIGVIINGTQVNDFYGSATTAGGTDIMILSSTYTTTLNADDVITIKNTMGEDFVLYAGGINATLFIWQLS